MSTQLASTAAVARDYLKLVRRFPLRPIRSLAENRLAVKLLAELMAKGDDRLTEGEGDYLAALGHFVDEFEKKHVRTLLAKATPLEVLRHLMESHGMTAADLGDVLGSRPAATMVLKGGREMSKSHIRAAAAHFHVSPAVFL